MPIGTAKRQTFLAPAVGVKVSMDDAIQILPIHDVPLHDLLSTEPITNIKNQWLNKELDPQTVTMTEASAAADLTIVFSGAPNSDANALRPGDILRPKEGVGAFTGGNPATVLLRVDSVVYSTGTITVTRPYNGSVDEALASGDVLEIIGQELVEGADPLDPRQTDPTGDYNITQTYQEQVAATRTVQKNEQYGTTNPFADDLAAKMKELPIRHERTLLHGLRKDNAASGLRQMGGLFQYVTQNTASGTKAEMETKLGDILQAAYGFGATPSVLVCSPAIKRAFSQLNASLVTEERGDTGVGRVKTVYHSDFGDITLVMDRHMPKFKALVLSLEYVKRQVFDNWFFEMLAKTGDSDKGHVVGEFSLKVKNPKAHGVLTVTDA
jgi:hypothetical protein